MGQRRRARECALQMLFQIDMAGGAPAEVYPDFWREHEVEPEVREFAQGLVDGVIGRRADLDETIAATAAHWRIERMAVVDRNILRMAVYELKHEPETPPAVVLDEAIEVAKKFGSDQSSAFINGILDAIRRRLDRGGLDGAGSHGADA
ncbi:MAG TPA: transcription antitermination factor NusB [Candidatus Sulfotelmatobacter sp.]|nr:transcription antitermination factor NusB [Candidatus Sulfotelmatobacter sp.]